MMANSTKTTTNGTGKIFISPHPYEEQLTEGFLSFGHKILERLTNENADTIIYVSISRHHLPDLSSLNVT